MPTLTISLQGQPRIERVFEALDEALDTTAILDQGGALLLNRLRTRYLKQVDPDGYKWERSKAAEKREKIGRGGGTLYDTGRLFGSIQLYADTANTRAIGTDVPYAVYAQDGPPQRTYMGFGESDAKLVQDFLIKRITEALNGLESAP